MSKIQRNDTITLLQQHRSIRKFTDQPLSPAVLKEIINAAQMASTSSHVQAYSMIGVTDADKKQKLAELAGNQTYVERCAQFFVFCADLYRLEHVVKQKRKDITQNLAYTEPFMVATIDAALAAQNAAIAAESFGLGIVYIGGIRNRPAEVSDLLCLPQKVYPVFGMCIGYPDQNPHTKPRLPQEAIYFENQYPSYEEYESSIHDYDQTMKQYYTERTGGKRTDSWSDMMKHVLGEPKRTHMKSFLEKQGFPLK